MSELKGFPFVNQRTDGNVNAEFDCVPASLAAAANYLLGQTALNDSVMKNTVYGSSYVGGTAASAYVPYLRDHGLHLFPLQGDYPTLVKQAHAHLAQGHPVVFTRDDPYAPAHPDWSHVCVWYADTPTSLTAMDPYGAQKITMSDAQWIMHLRFNEIWIMEREETMLTLDPKVFRQVGEHPTVWQCLDKDHEHTVLGAILAFYRGLNGALGLPNTGEHYDIPDYVWQEFQNGIVLYSKKTNSCTLVDLRSDLAKKILDIQQPAPDPTDLANQLFIASNALNTASAAIVKAQVSLK